MKFSVGVVLPAAGCGERMGLPVPKQFCKVLGRPLISYTIEAFERISWISSIVVVTHAEKKIEMDNILKSYNHSSRVLIAEGASVRHRSIYNGLMELQRVSGGPPMVVVVHDAVRPFVDEETVKKVAVAAETDGSAGAIRPLISTVIATDSNGFLDHSLDRTKYRASEMPQAFLFDVIKKAYDRCTDYDFDYGTECLHLVDKYVGIKARLVEGPDTLWKVTLRKDLYAAEGMFLEEERSVRVHGFIPSQEFSSLLQKELAKFDFKVLNDSMNDDDQKPSHHITYFESVMLWNESHLLTAMSASSLIIVVKSEDHMSNFAEVHQKLTSLSTKCSRCTVNAVLIKETSDLRNVCELVVSLIQKRNINLNAQVLLR